MTEKIDLRKQYKYLYAPSAKKPEIIEVPRFNFVMVDGVVQPDKPPAESAEFQDCLQAVYGAAFTLKFMSKLNKINPIDYTIMALDGLWWLESGEFDFHKQEAWFFTLMMLQPEHITPVMFSEALEQMRKKRDNPKIARLRLESFAEGLSVQIMHIGPYATEPATIEKMRSYAFENGYRFCGKHHEIYMGDPRRAKPEKLRTILRHPIEKS